MNKLTSLEPRSNFLGGFLLLCARNRFFHSFSLASGQTVIAGMPLPGAARAECRPWFPRLTDGLLRSALPCDVFDVAQAAGWIRRDKRLTWSNFRKVFAKICYTALSLACR